MSRELEQKVADVIITALNGLVEVRTGEQSASIPESSMVTVQLESQQLRTPAITNLFDSKVKVILKMHHADKTEAEMDQAGSVILDTLTEVSLSSSLNSYLTQLKDTKADVGEGYWLREYNLEVLSVDTAT